MFNAIQVALIDAGLVKGCTTCHGTCRVPTGKTEKKYIHRLKMRVDVPAYKQCWKCNGIGKIANGRRVAA